MIQLNNPSVTSPRAGSRSRNKSPRDTTGRRYEELHREAEARKSAANIDINEVRRAEFSRGFDAGHAAGMDAGVLAVLNVYRAEGASGVQNLIDELDGDDEPEDVA